MMICGELEGLTALAQGDAEQLLLTIQSSLQIRRRYQFCSWAQSRLYAMVPHDLLLCARYEPVRRGMVYDSFSMFPLPQPLMERVFDSGVGLMPGLVQLWNDTQRMPCGIEQAAAEAGRNAGLLERIGAHEICEFIAHGTASPHDDRIETFFCFARVAARLVPEQVKRETRPLTARHSFMVELLMPYMHATYHRIIAAERVREAPRAESAAADAVVTQRETEILGWVREGKSNQEIGVLLVISPLTVKNHVQKILRKLGASNRAQAVSKAISMRLIAGSNGIERQRN